MGGCGCGSANMNYAMSPSTKRMMVAKQGMSKPSMGSPNQGMGSSSYATIPTPKHIGPATQQTTNSNYANQYAQQSNQYAGQPNQYSQQSGQYAQQSSQPNKYRVARRPQPQQQPSAQQMMYQQ
jgi:hypothetical protein